MKSILARCLPWGLLCVSLASCAAGPRAFRAPGPGLPPGTPIALLPLTNLTTEENADELFAAGLLLELGRLRYFDVQDPGLILGYLRELRILNPDRISSEKMAQLSERSGARYLLCGTVTSCEDRSDTPAGLPSAALSLRLTDARTGTVLWAASLARSGRDRETFFGLGRARTLESLTASIARDMVGSMDLLTTPGPAMLAATRREPKR